MTNSIQLRSSLACTLTLLALVAACDSPTTPAATSVAIGGPGEIRFNSLGESAALSVTVRGGTTGDVRWRSTNGRVADVDRAGVVTAAGDGNAIVIASLDGVADSVGITVLQEPVGLQFLDQPEHVVRAATFQQSIRVALVDALGHAVGTQSVTISLSLTGSGPGALEGTLVRPAVHGVATFDDLSVSDAGSSYRLHANTSGATFDFDSESIPFDVASAGDIVVLRNRVLEAGMLVDGGGASGVLNDRGFIVTDSTLQLVLGPSPASNEIIAFTEGRPPVLATAQWTNSPDTVVVGFFDRIEIPVTVWIVRGPFDTQRQRAASAIMTTAAIWNDERMGISFSDVEFVDATANPDAASLFDQTLCNQQSRTVSSIGQRAGRINVYYVATVDGGAGRGRACGASFIIMAERSGHELLAHEFGHSFGLGHVDGDARYDQTNVMHSASDVREYLTEGQVFRSHYNAFSALRSIYSARSDPTRNCPDAVQSTTCPALERRLWPDGSFPSDGPAMVARQTDIERWLVADCGTGENVDETAALRASPRAEAMLLAVLAASDSELVADIADRSLRRFTILRASLRSVPADERLLSVLATIDPATYRERVHSDVEASLRLRAISGLALVGTEKAVPGLRALALESAGIYASAARAALASIAGRRR